LKLNLIWNTLFAQTFSQLALQVKGEIASTLQITKTILIQVINAVTKVSYSSDPFCDYTVFLKWPNL